MFVTCNVSEKMTTARDIFTSLEDDNSDHGDDNADNGIDNVSGLSTTDNTNPAVSSKQANMNRTPDRNALTDEGINQICSYLRDLTLEIRNNNDHVSALMSYIVHMNGDQAMVNVPNPDMSVNDSTCNSYGAQYTSSIAIDTSPPVDKSTERLSTVTLNNSRKMSTVSDKSSQGNANKSESMSVNSGMLMSNIGALENRKGTSAIPSNRVRNHSVHKMNTRSRAPKYSYILEGDERSDVSEKMIMIKNVLKTNSKAISFVITAMLQGLHDAINTEYELEMCGYEEAFQDIAEIVQALTHICGKSYRKKNVDSMSHYITDMLKALQSSSGIPTAYRIAAPTYHNITKDIPSSHMFAQIVEQVCRVISWLPLMFHPTIATVAEYVVSCRNIVSEDNNTYNYVLNKEAIARIHNDYKSICKPNPYGGYFKESCVLEELSAEISKSLHRKMLLKLMCQLMVLKTDLNATIDSTIKARHVHVFVMIMCYRELKNICCPRLKTNLEIAARFEFEKMIDIYNITMPRDKKLAISLDYACNILPKIGNLTHSMMAAITRYENKQR